MHPLKAFAQGWREHVTDRQMRQLLKIYIAGILLAEAVERNDRFNIAGGVMRISHALRVGQLLTEEQALAIDDELVAEE